MESSQQLRQLLREQRDQLGKLEQAVTELERTDLARKVQELEQQGGELLRKNEELAARMAQSEQHTQALLADNRNLRGRLSEEMNRQREVLLEDARKQAHLLFGAEENMQVDHLARYHANLRARLDSIRAELEPHRPLSEELLAQVQQLEARSREFMRDATGALQRQMDAARAADEAERAALGQAPANLAGFERRPQPARVDRDRLEMRIGMRITIIVGAFFMLLAVVFGLRYSFVHLQSDILKGALAYFIGFLFLGGGELLHRRQPSAFSTGVCAGGIAILFASTAVSYFTLGILSIPAAVLACIAVTVLALLQSIRYDAQLIAVFALIGGYLPMTAVDKSPIMILSAMAYFLVLNLFVLLVALRRRWQPLKYISLVAGWASVNYLLILSGYELVGGLFYILANLLLYMAIVLVYPILRRAVLRVSDTVLLGINTLYGCVNLFLLLERNHLTSLNGAVSLALCLLFFLLAKWLRVALEQDAGSRGLFYITSFAFWVLAVPLQFQPDMISLFWMIEGAGLFVFGTLTDRIWYRRAGGGIAILCCLSFLPYLLDNYLYNSWWSSTAEYTWRYGAITLGLLVMVGVALYKHPIGHAYWRTTEGFFVRAFKGISIVNLWMFAIYLIQTEFAQLAVFRDPRGDFRWERFWTGLLSVVATLGIGVLCRAIPRLRTKGTVLLARIFYVIGLLSVLGNGSMRVPGNGIVFVAALCLLMALSCGAVLAFYDLLRGWGRSAGENLTLGTSLYALVVVLQLLMVQGRFGFRSMAVSFVLIAWALGFILYGFIGRHALLRRFGLGLSLLSISKLFLLDLSFLPEGQRVISYFVFSVVFIGISFVYQHFARRLFPPTSPGESAAAAPPSPGLPLEQPAPLQLDGTRQADTISDPISQETAPPPESPEAEA